MESNLPPFQGNSFADRQEPDPRAIEALLGVGLRHGFDASSGLFMVDHVFKNGVVQTVQITSRTTRFLGLEVREITSPSFIEEGTFRPEVAMPLLGKNIAAFKAWQAVPGRRNKKLVEYRMWVPASLSGEALAKAIDFVAGSALEGRQLAEHASPFMQVGITPFSDNDPCSSNESQMLRTPDRHVEGLLRELGMDYKNDEDAFGANLLHSCSDGSLQELDINHITSDFFGVEFREISGQGLCSDTEFDEATLHFLLHENAQFKSGAWAAFNGSDTGFCLAIFLTPVRANLTAAELSVVLDQMANFVHGAADRLEDFKAQAN